MTWFCCCTTFFVDVGGALVYGDVFLLSFAGLYFLLGLSWFLCSIPAAFVFFFFFVYSVCSWMHGWQLADGLGVCAWWLVVSYDLGRDFWLLVSKVVA